MPSSPLPTTPFRLLKWYECLGRFCELQLRRWTPVMCLPHHAKYFIIFTRYTDQFSLKGAMYMCLCVCAIDLYQKRHGPETSVKRTYLKKMQNKETFFLRFSKKILSLDFLGLVLLIFISPRFDQSSDFWTWYVVWGVSHWWRKTPLQGKTWLQKLNIQIKKEH